MEMESGMNILSNIANESSWNWFKTIKLIYGNEFNIKV